MTRRRGGRLSREIDVEQEHQVLVLVAHPALEKSRVNEPLVQAARAVAGVTVHDLYDTYPQFFIDKTREQQLVKRHKVIVLQHPLYWYSVPALMKEWMEIVLEHGFAYGRGGEGLAGQVMMNAWSAGSTRAELCGDGGGDLVAQLMRPVELTARYCGMRYLPPFTLFDSGSLRRTQIDAACAGYAQLLRQLTTASFLDRNLESFTCINDALEATSHG